MKKKLSILMLAGVLALSLAACGGSSEPSGGASAKAESTKTESAAVSETVSEAETETTQESEAETAAASSEETAETSEPEETTAVSEAPETETTPAAEASPYSWLGLQDMPQCRYLDLYCSYHYIQVSDNYVMSFVSEQTEAVDGINTYTASPNQRTWSVDGKVLSVNESSKIYMEYELSETVVEEARKNMENAKASGENAMARVFQGTGTGTIPVYAEESGDTAEYEYYEYLTDGSTDDYIYRTTERFYMKDGDVFAIYTAAQAGETEVETTKVIKSISDEIPEGTFDLPDLTGYEKYE